MLIAISDLQMPILNAMQQTMLEFIYLQDTEPNEIDSTVNFLVTKTIEKIGPRVVNNVRQYVQFVKNQQTKTNKHDICLLSYPI